MRSVHPITSSRQASVPRFRDLPFTDSLGTIRRVQSNGVLYQRIVHSILPEASWFEYGAVPAYTTQEGGYVLPDYDWKFLFCGYPDAPPAELKAAIGVSVDGVNIYNIATEANPFVYSAAGGVRDPTIVKKGIYYVMAHGNAAGPPYQIHLAISTDKVNWTFLGTLDMTLTTSYQGGAINNVSASALSWNEGPDWCHLVVMTDSDEGRLHYEMHPQNTNALTWGDQLNWTDTTQMLFELNPVATGNFYTTIDGSSWYSLENDSPVSGNYYTRSGPVGVTDGWLERTLISAPGLPASGDSDGIAISDGVMFAWISNGNTLNHTRQMLRSEDLGTTWDNPIITINHGFGAVNGLINWFPGRSYI